MIQKTLIATFVSLVMLSGCSDSNDAGSPTDPSNDNGEGQSDSGGTNTGNNGDGSGVQQVNNRSLDTLDNSEAFFDALREGLVQQSANYNNDVAFTQVAAIESADSADDSGGAAGSSDAASGPPLPDDVTTTNVQEAGVDEQDRVKSDGKFLYVLQNTYSSFGATDDAIDIPDDGDIPQPTDSTMLVPEQNVTATLRILSMQNEAPDAQPLTEFGLNLGNGYVDGMYLYKSDSGTNVFVSSSSYADFHGGWNDSYAYSQSVSTITNLNVTDPLQTAIEKSLRVQGQIISSRRIGKHLYLASRYYPFVQGADPYNMSPEEYQQVVENADLSESLPKITTLNPGFDTGEEVDLVNPAACFVAAKPESADYYYTPDIISLAVIDLDTLELKDSECFLGSTETLYATPESIFLATTRWDYSNQQGIPVDNNDVVSLEDFSDPRVDTDIHRFAIDGNQLNYSGSGVVSGHLGWNPLRKPFRMSEKDGYLRVATFSATQNESVSPILVSVLDISGTDSLTKIAELPNPNYPEHIGKPGEQLYASRFLGDRAYLVTFRQTDPLYVVDFENHQDPKLAGELEIEGFSDYLQPIGEDYLLGIGRDAVPVGGNEFGAVQGVKLSLFNVADANNPTEVQSMVIGEAGTQAAALFNHRAITVQRATDLHPTRVAFGIDVAGLAEPRPVTDPSAWYPWNYTGLHGFDINVGDNAGIEQRGAMVVNSASNPAYSEFGYYGDDRSVIVNDSVYYIYGSSVFTANWDDLSNFTGPR